MKNAQQPSKALNIALWGTQGLLAALFLMAGVTKVVKPIEELAPMMPWVLDMPAFMVRFIGISEMAGALGLILPAALRIMPRLTGFAGIGLGVIMLLASGHHAMAGEFPNIGANMVLLSLALFVAWGRLIRLPIQPK